MRIKLTHNYSKKSLAVFTKLKELVLAEDFQLVDEQPDIIITVGGDGTLLSAFEKHQDLIDSVRFIGLHTGHLGFYTDWREYDLERLIEGLKKDTGEYIEYPLLDVTVFCTQGQEPRHYLALNESTIKRHDSTLVCDVGIRDELFERFRGDGLCVSTPTGSTGLNKSLGGAVLHPRLKALQLTEMASLNNRVFRTLSSPLVIAPDEWINLKPINTDSFMLSIDQNVYHEHHVKSVQYRISDKTIRFARYEHTHFWDRVEDAFLGAKKRHES